MRLLRERLDLELESQMGYFYTDIFAHFFAEDPEFEVVSLHVSLRAATH